MPKVTEFLAAITNVTEKENRQLLRLDISKCYLAICDVIDLYIPITSCRHDNVRVSLAPCEAEKTVAPRICLYVRISV